MGGLLFWFLEPVAMDTLGSTFHQEKPVRANGMLGKDNWEITVEAADGR